MRSRTIKLGLPVLVLLLVLLATSIWLVGEGRGPTFIENVAIAPAPIPSPTPEVSWLILPPMPMDATEADIGAEIYRLVCRDCHGDRGQGLTDEFRATWDPKDQNCWQSKCHSPPLRPEGFFLPHYIPAIIGPNTLARFEGAADLQEFIQKNMPWHDPGSLTQEEYWQLTAFILRENELDPGISPD